MTAVQRFYELTLEIIQFLERVELDRDTKISKTEGLLVQREALIKEITSPYSAEEVMIGKSIIELNRKLSQLLQAEHASIQKDLKGLQTKKETNNKYVNPYQSLSTDGMFYDQRK